MSINMECATVEELWEDEHELIRVKSKEFAKQLALPARQLGRLQAIVREVRYDAMRDALYTGRKKGYYEGRREGHDALVAILHEILKQCGEAITADVSKRIAVAKMSELIIWIRLLLAGDEARTIFF